MTKTARTCFVAVLICVAGCAARAQAPKDPKAHAVSDTSAKEQKDPDGAPQTGRVESDRRKTPFGVVKTTGAKPAPRPPSATAVSHLVQVEEQGEEIVFRQRTPFGQRVWKRNRSELSSQEQELLEAHQAAKPRPAREGASSSSRPKSEKNGAQRQTGR